MKIKGLIPFINNIANWIIRLAYVNVLWLVFSALGLIIFGLFPSTIALFTVIRQWIKHGTHIPVWKTYKDTFKKDFMEANLIGYFYSIIGVVTFIDLRFFQTQSGLIYTTLSYTFIMISVVYVIIGLFLLPVYVHYDFKMLQYIKHTFFIVTSKPLIFLIILIVFTFVCVVMLFIPGLIVLFGISLPAFIIMWTSYNVFTKI